MSATFDLFEIKTVPPSYSWDDGVPGQEFPFNQLVTDLLSGTDSEYIGYAPYVFVSLSSSPEEQALSAIAIRRIVDFGDYYNSEYNLVTTPTLSNELFCHNYIMPGLYSVTFTQNQYVEGEQQQFGGIECLEKGGGSYDCLSWTWRNLDCAFPGKPIVRWADTLSGAPFEKLWKFEPCEAAWATLGGLYVQPSEQEQRLPISWQWYNFLCNNPTNPKNEPVQWSQSIFQGSSQLTWSQTTGPCIEINDQEGVVWTWDNTTCDLTANPFANNTTWDETRCSEPTNKTWDQIADNCTETSINVVEISETQTKTHLIRVLEIPPTAYLSAIQPNYNDRFSPLTVVLTPRFIKTGSFPIEKIVWDLGDGSPLLTQRRWSNTVDSPFTYTNVYNLDYQDPRNFDIIYTYNRTSQDTILFYPSLTAYASSTGTSDCCSAVVGPLRIGNLDPNKINLIQNELTDHGKVYAGIIENTAAVWKSE